MEETMQVIDVPFVKQEDDDTCALLKPDVNKFAPEGVVVDEIIKVFTLMPKVKERVILRMRKEGLNV
jgi:hypothetical protein